MYKIKQILIKNIDLPYYLIYYISTFLTKIDIISEYKLLNSFTYKIVIRQRHKNIFNYYKDN